MNFINKYLLPKQHIFFTLLKNLSNSQKEMAMIFKECVLDFQNFQKHAKKAKEMEHTADMKAHELIDAVNKTFITPIDREDLYLLAHEIDTIVDLMENAINNIKLYEIKELLPAMIQFADLIHEASRDLDDLLHHFQQQKRSEHLHKIKIKIHELEDKGDVIFHEALHKLFKEEKDPILVIKWKDILENVEQIMDQYQKVSDTIDGVIVKSS